MRKITHLLTIIFVAMLAACDKPIDTTVPTLEVNPHNLKGTWQLAEWNGASLAEGTYVYIIIDSDLTFEMYQNTNSMYTERLTGTCKLEEDWRVGDVISGVYDYEQGKWANEYAITDLYKESMTWTSKVDTAKGEVAEVQKFVRVGKVPDYIVEAARKPME